MPKTTNYTLRLTNGAETADFCFANGACMWATGDEAGSATQAEAERVVAQMLSAGWVVTYSDVQEAA